MCCIVWTYPPDPRNGAEDRPEDEKNGSSSAEVDRRSILRPPAVANDASGRLSSASLGMLLYVDLKKA